MKWICPKYFTKEGKAKNIHCKCWINSFQLSENNQWILHINLRLKMKNEIKLKQNKGKRLVKPYSDIVYEYIFQEPDQENEIENKNDKERIRKPLYQRNQVQIP